MSAALGIIFFSWSIPVLLLIISFFAPKISSIDYRDILFRKTLLIFSCIFFILSSGIVLSVGVTDGYTLGNEFSIYITVFQLASYIGTIALIINTIFSYHLSKKEYKQKIRTGDDED